jgi:anaerobic magnesium-protoporphyrin IX monomethyl ester cyclase
MRVLLLNPPHPAVSSRCHDGQLPPLGLLAVGGPLIDVEHPVRLLDAEFGPLSNEEIVSAVTSWGPDAVFIGRGEGEATSPRLLAAIESGMSLASVPGIAYREASVVYVNRLATPICDLDAYRVGWELIEDWELYQYWGASRAAVVQFSRGCPHRCTYCGQRGFWTRWRHRDRARTAAEIGWLHRTHGVRFVDLADENPTSCQRLWRDFLEALIAEQVPVQLVATIRAGDIVRDAAILHLYKKAGFSRILHTTPTKSTRCMSRPIAGHPSIERVQVAASRSLIRAGGITATKCWAQAFLLGACSRG